MRRKRRCRSRPSPPAELQPTDVLVRIRAAGLCHTDLEVIDGSLRYPMPIVLGHEAAGVVERTGAAARGVKAGDHVVLSWNPQLRALLLLRSRCADPVRAVSRRGAEGGRVRRRHAHLARRRRRAAPVDVPGSVRRVLHRQRSAGDPRAEGDSVRPRLPDRLRRDDRRRRRAQSRRHRAWRHRDGDRLRRGRARRRAGRAARGRGRHHRGRSRSGEAGAGRENGRDRRRRCIEGRCRPRSASA